MRKHNKKFAMRWTRWPGDRTNFPQSTAHSFVNEKSNQIFSNGLLLSLIARI